MLIPELQYLMQETARRRPQHIKKYFPEFYELVLTFSGKRFVEKLYKYYNPVVIYCPCGKETQFENFATGYRKYCCGQCASIYTRDKSKQTCLERYGVEVPIQNKDIKNKIEQTCLKKYGVKKPLCNQEILSRARQNYKDTCLKKYGVITPFHDKSIQELSRQTKLKKYGSISHNSSYKTNNPSHDPELLKKAIKTKQIHFIKKYNLAGYDDFGNWLVKCYNPNCNKCSNKYFAISSGMYHDRLKTGTELCTILNPIGSYSQTRLETYVQSILTSKNISFKTHDRSLLKTHELDIYIPDLKIAIECNGIYWHSTDKKPDKFYHFNKLKQCYEMGVRLINIWEHWTDNQIIRIIESVISGYVDEDLVFEIYGDYKQHFDICPWDGKTPVIRKRTHKIFSYFDSGESRH